MKPKSIEFEKIKSLEKLVKLEIFNFINNPLNGMKGVSTDYSPARDYIQGDSIKSVDWKTSARRGKLLVRDRIEQKMQTILIMLDISSSMSLGGKKTKFKQGLIAASALSYLVINNGDKVGLVTFSDRIIDKALPQKGTKHLYSLFDILVKTYPNGNTDLKKVIANVLPCLKTKTVIFLLTDLRDKPESMIKALKLLKIHKHEVSLFHIYDADAFKFPTKIEKISFTDSDTGKKILMNTKDPLFQVTYRSLIRKQTVKKNSFMKKIMSSGIEIIDVSTKEILEKVLAKYILYRKRGRLLL